MENLLHYFHHNILGLSQCNIDMGYRSNIS